MTVIKRFIAGAVCPRCGQMDCLRMYRDDEREYRECVRCDFEDTQRLDGTAEVKELETRVNQAKPVLDDGERPIRFVPNPVKDSSK
jgi:uncharacterized metal-binding protein (TIGR02443 family)